MKLWFVQVGKRAMLAGVMLAMAGIAVALLLRKALEETELETNADHVPLVFGAVLGTTGFVLAILFELIAAGWKRLHIQRRLHSEPRSEPHR